MDNKYRESERGSAGIKLVLVMLGLALAGNAAYNYIPTAYEAANLRQDMQTAVINGVSMPAINRTAVDVVKEKIMSATRANHVPANALIEVKQLNNLVQAHVRYTKPVPVVPFGIYTYNYEFDNTATPGGFLAKE